MRASGDGSKAILFSVEWLLLLLQCLPHELMEFSHVGTSRFPLS